MPSFPRLLLPRLLPRAWARYFPRWDGHNVQASQVFVPRLPKTASTEGGTATSSTADAVPLLPWGFVPQSLVRARVAPLRLALAAPRHTDKKGGQQGQQEHQEQEDDHYQTVLLGTHHTNPEVAELFAALQADFAEGAKQAYLAISSAFLSRQDFTETSYCSPDLSCFLNHVRSSYAKRNVEPRLTVHNVTARLKALRLEHGFVCDNRHFLGLMGKREAWHHFFVGAAGPESQLIQELSNGDFPRRLTAEVEFEVQETFQLVGPGATVAGKGPEEEEEGGQGAAVATRQHYFTFESDFLRGTEPEWQVTNINDAIKSPSLSSLLMMCGATGSSSSSSPSASA